MDGPILTWFVTALVLIALGLFVLFGFGVTAVALGSLIILAVVMVWAESGR